MPALGWTAVDRKGYRLNVPISDEVRDAIRKKAAKQGLTQTEWARNILTRAAGVGK